MGTRTGNYRTGFRRGGGEWQKDLKALASWAKETGYDSIDLPRCSPENIATLSAAGLVIGSVDIIDAALMSPDESKRKDAVAKIAESIKTLGEAGAKAFFTVAIPEDRDAKRLDNHKLAVESFGLEVEYHGLVRHRLEKRHQLIARMAAKADH